VNRRLLSSVAVGATTCALELFAYAQPTVVVRGDVACPSVEMIRAALQTARPDGAWPQQTVTVDVGSDRLALGLGEAPTVRREIPADPDCGVRAESIAVVIAAWSGELASGPTDSPVLGMPAATTTAPSPATTAPSPVATTAPGPVAATATSPAPVPTPAKKLRYVFELDGAAFYSPLWGHAPGAWLGVGRTPENGGFGLRALGVYQAARDVALEGGTNQVLRLMLGAAVTYHLQRKHLFASGDVGLVGTYTRASGSGYQPDRADSATNFGGVADLRGGLRLGRIRLWVDARLLRLVHSESVKIQSSSPGVADSAELGAWDLQVGGGLGFRFE
jgi:hypothetical protein